MSVQELVQGTKGPRWQERNPGRQLDAQAVARLEKLDVLRAGTLAIRVLLNPQQMAQH